MQRTEFETARVRVAILEAKPVLAEDLNRQVNSARQSVNSRRSFLKVVAYPWGVEFDLVDEEEQK